MKTTLSVVPSTAGSLDPNRWPRPTATYQPYPQQRPANTVSNAGHPLILIPSDVYIDHIVVFLSAIDIQPLMNTCKDMRQKLINLGVENGYEHWVQKVSKQLEAIKSVKAAGVMISAEYTKQVEDYEQSLYRALRQPTQVLKKAKMLWNGVKLDSVEAVMRFVESNSVIQPDSKGRKHSTVADNVTNAFSALVQQSYSKHQRAYMACIYLEKHVCLQCKVIVDKFVTCCGCELRKCAACSLTHMFADDTPVTRTNKDAECTHCGRIVCSECVEFFAVNEYKYPFYKRDVDDIFIHGGVHVRCKQCRDTMANLKTALAE